MSPSNWWSTIRLIAPEVAGLVERRYAMLRAIVADEPVGRRMLAERLGWSERVTRSEAEQLRDFGLIDMHNSGIALTDAGRQGLDHIARLAGELNGLHTIEQQLTERFGLDHAIVVPGDSSRDPIARMDLARAAGTELLATIDEGTVVAVSGGSTLADLAGLLPAHQQQPGVTVVPTGGGLGDTLEIEANSIAARLASALGATYRLLHLRDDLPEHSVTALLNENPAFREIFGLIRSAHVVVQGVGTMRDVAQRRGFDPARTEELEQRGAVGESLGYFFDAAGAIVDSAGTVGMRIDDLRQARAIILVAGGSAKAAAITSLLHTGMRQILVTDEAAGQLIVAGGAH